MRPNGSTGPDRLRVARIAAPHGVRGLVRLRVDALDLEALCAGGPLLDGAGRSLAVTLKSRAGEEWLARIEGVEDRDAAQALAGTDLYVPRDRLPPLEDEEEFYHADLIGLRAETGAGEAIGAIEAVVNFGAGDLLQVRRANGRPVMIPFTRAIVPQVDLAAGRLIVDPPAGLLE